MNVMESAVPLVKGHDMPPAGKASTVMRQSLNGQPGAQEEINRLQLSLSALTIDKERVSEYSLMLFRSKTNNGD